MGRHQTRLSHFAGITLPGYQPEGPAWSRAYLCQWSQVVGGRIAAFVRAAVGGCATSASGSRSPMEPATRPAYFSRLERGWSSPSLYVYLAIAAAFEVEPGVLLGADEVSRDTTPEQRVLLDYLERRGIEPVEAMARLAG